MNPAPLRSILVIEDSAEDFTALHRAFGKTGARHPLLRCADGDQALDYLQGRTQPPAWPRTRPAIILLDLNLPGTDGRAVLQVLKQDPLLHAIPVIVFTTSTNNRDVEECYRLGANSYLTKPIEYAALVEKVGLIVRYWLELSELPLLPS